MVCEFAQLKVMVVANLIYIANLILANVVYSKQIDFNNCWIPCKLKKKYDLNDQFTLTQLNGSLMTVLMSPFSQICP